MRLDNDSEELSAGRLFIHGRVNDPMTGGPLYCRILSFDGAWVEYEPITPRGRVGAARKPQAAADRGLLGVLVRNVSPAAKPAPLRAAGGADRS